MRGWMKHSKELCRRKSRGGSSNNSSYTRGCWSYMNFRGQGSCSCRTCKHDSWKSQKRRRQSRQEIILSRWILQNKTKNECSYNV